MKSMAKRTSKTTGSLFLLQLFAAIFLITTGILGIIHYNSDLQQFGRAVNELFGKSNNPLNLIIAIVELAGGIIIGAQLFITVGRQFMTIATWAVVVVWIIKTIMSFFTKDIFEPDFIIWLNGVSVYLLYIVVFWTLNRQK